MGTALTGARADRWGVPVQGTTDAGLAAFNEAVECLLALAGDPVAGAQAGVAAAPGMMLGRVYEAYLALYGTTAAGVTTALQILDGLGEPGAEREAWHLRAARSWAAGDWAGAARALERALVSHPRDVLALKVAQDLYFSLAGGSTCGMSRGRCWRTGRTGSRAGAMCRECTRSGWRRTPTTSRRWPAGRPPLTTTRATCGRCTRSRTCMRCAVPTGTAWPSSQPPHPTGPAATSRGTTGGTAACTTWNSGRLARRWPCMTPGSGPAGPRNGWTSSTPPRCCGG
jgi:hypothetical protein